MKQTELIIFLVVLAVNGGIALWKKIKERQAAAQAARGQARPAPRAAPARPTPASRPAAVRPTAPAMAAAPVVRAASPAARSHPATRSQPAAIPPGRRSRTGIAAPARGSIALPTTAAGLRNAVLLAEVLGPPRSIQPWSAAVQP